jgi:hypothetical protein
MPLAPLPTPPRTLVLLLPTPVLLLAPPPVLPVPPPLVPLPTLPRTPLAPLPMPPRLALLLPPTLPRKPPTRLLRLPRPLPSLHSDLCMKDRASVRCSSRRQKAALGRLFHWVDSSSLRWVARFT